MSINTAGLDDQAANVKKASAALDGARPLCRYGSGLEHTQRWAPLTTLRRRRATQTLNRG